MMSDCDGICVQVSDCRKSKPDAVVGLGKCQMRVRIAAGCEDRTASSPGGVVDEASGIAGAEDHEWSVCNATHGGLRYRPGRPWGLPGHIVAGVLDVVLGRLFEPRQLGFPEWPFDVGR